MDSSLFYTTCAVATSFFTLLVTLCFMLYKKIRFSGENNKKTENSSSLSVLPPSLPRNWIYNVFPSFHGADVRKSFLSHILKEFKNKGITPFIDNEIKRGEFIGPELIEAIRGSRIAIVLLSKRYASSSWCLDELVEIINCKENFGQTVMAIFYKVDPTDVKKQMGEFGKVFRKTCKGKTTEVTERWKQALAKVATIAGYHSSIWVDEAAMIENIAADISKILNQLAPSSPYLDHLIGMGAHMERLQLLLRLDLDEVRMIGIWGPLGIGKSTIVRILFNQLSNGFQFRAIMVNIKGSYPRPCLDEGSAQLQLQNQMLSLLFNHKDTMITHLGVAQERLKDKNVFLVLDDVDHLGQLEALTREVEWFGPGSRIIIATEDLKLLKAHGIDHIYKVDFPSDDEALQMFCMYAFGQKYPKDGFTKLSKEITYLAGKLPLGLKVMGSYFRRMSKQDWTRVLPSLRNRLNGEIESILKFSYDALCDENKNLFLHIACFFNYEKIENVEEHLANKFLDVRQGLQVLADKSLISLGQGRTVMHSLLAQLGKEIVRKQSNRKPGKRQFLVDSKDIGEVFTDPTAVSKAVIGVHFGRLAQNGDKINISERAFEGMYNLQFLLLDGDLGQPNITSLMGCLKYISPKLQLLNWGHAPMTCLPIIVNLEFLVELIMDYSKLEKLWEGTKLLQNLKWMDLSRSENLKELPNLSTATSLEILNLRGCSSLVELPFSIGNATNLQTLDLSDCSSLVELPSSIGNTTNLRLLDLTNCSSMVKLPSSIGNLHRLTTFHLKGCSKLEVLPTDINLESLIELDLTNCWSLKEFPEISTNIEVLKLRGTTIEEVPSSISSWSRLKELKMTYHENLKGSPHAFDSFTELYYNNTPIQEIGPWVKGCSRLRGIEVTECRNLVSLPQLPDNILFVNAVNCESLERLDCSFRNPGVMLNFLRCFKLNQEARDNIIQTSTFNFLVLPGVEVPACFTYRASGSCVTVKLNEKPLCTSTKFKACIFLDCYMDQDLFGPELFTVRCIITSKENGLPSYSDRAMFTKDSKHLYIFEVEANEVTSTEFVFQFELENDDNLPWEIEECGILQLF